MTPEERRAKSIEARQFAQSPMFAQMFDGVADALEGRALACPSTDEKLAADIVRCKQLLAAMRREIERRVEDGEFASFEIEQLRKRGAIASIFKR